LTKEKKEMGKVYFSLTVNGDGSINVPAFAIRGLGYAPGDSVSLIVPAEQPPCDCESREDELLLSRYCAGAPTAGYTTDGEEVNIPARMFAKAGLPAGTTVYAMTGDRALVLAAGAGDCEDLPEKIAGLLDDLGIEAGGCIPLETDF
jgi:hypothetical protein